MAAEMPLAGIIVDHGRSIRRVERMLRLIRSTVRRNSSRAQCGPWSQESGEMRLLLSVPCWAVLGPENCSQFSPTQSSSPCARHQHARGHRGGFLFGPGCDPGLRNGDRGKTGLSRARKTALNMHTGSPRITEGAIAISGLSTTGNFTCSEQPFTNV